MIRSLLSVLLLALSLPAIFAQTNVTYIYNGTTTCTYQFNQRSISTNPIRIVSISGQLTLDLSAGVMRVPNAPISAGLFDGSATQAYPISFINGTRSSVVTGTGAGRNLSTVTGLTTPAWIYLTVADGSQYNIGYLTDPQFQWVLDYSGITLALTPGSPSSVTVALIAELPNMQYSELDLLSSGLWNNGTFQLSACTMNTFTTTIINNTVITPPPSSAVGDPQFMGFRGQSYQIHGMADTVYSIISDRNIQLNALFVFLTQGQCPVVAGKRLTNCWSHPGSYFGSLSLQTVNGDKLFLQSGAANTGFLSVNFNGKNVSAPVMLKGLDSKSGIAPVTLTLVNTHRLTLDTGLYQFTMENSDSFINILSVEISDWHQLTHSVKSHGLLGQTWQSRKGVIEGTVDDYVEANNDMFGNGFLFNQFTPLADN